VGFGGAAAVGRYSLLAMAAAWELTASALERLLVRLDPDPTRAAAAYEALRHSLTRFFDWRGAHFPDECADETLNRLARRLEEGAAVDDIRSFALGIARLVRLEQARSPQARQDALDEQRLGALPAAEPDGEPRLYECLESCLASLPADARTLILEYYQDQRRQKIDRRVRLATQLGLSANALRSRAQRVRDRLERCVRTCAARRAGDTNPGAAHFPRGDPAGDRRGASLRQTDDAP
jgi:DNA-directed RNA polymerase specialized sigma24 family protein